MCIRDRHYDSYATDKELEAIFEKTFGPIQRKKYTEKKVRNYSPKPKLHKGKQKNHLPECVLVDEMCIRDSRKMLCYSQDVSHFC